MRFCLDLKHSQWDNSNDSLNLNTFHWSHLDTTLQEFFTSTFFTSFNVGTIRYCGATCTVTQSEHKLPCVTTVVVTSEVATGSEDRVTITTEHQRAHLHSEEKNRIIFECVFSVYEPSHGFFILECICHPCVQTGYLYLMSRSPGQQNCSRGAQSSKIHVYSENKKVSQ